MGKKCTNIEKDERIYRLVRLIANGATSSDMVQYASKEWGVGRRQADTYIALAREVIVADINRDRPQIVAELITTCQQVIKNGMKTNNLNVVIGAVHAISKLGGLEPKQ